MKTLEEDIMGILCDVEVGKDCGNGHVVLQQKSFHTAEEMTVKNYSYGTVQEIQNINPTKASK